MYVQTLSRLGAAEQNSKQDGSTRLDQYTGLCKSPSIIDKFTVRVAFKVMKFLVTDEFLDSWLKLSPAGRIGSTEQFCKAFCEGNHYKVVYSRQGDKRLLSAYERRIGFSSS